MFSLKKSLIFSIALIVAGLFSFIFFTNSIEAKMKKEAVILEQPGGKNAWTQPAGYYGEHGEGVESDEPEPDPDTDDGDWPPAVDQFPKEDKPTPDNDWPPSEDQFPNAGPGVNTWPDDDLDEFD